MPIQSTGDATARVVLHESLESIVRNAFFNSRQNELTSRDRVFKDRYIEEHFEEFNEFRDAYIGSMVTPHKELGRYSTIALQVVTASKKYLGSKFPEIETGQLAALKTAFHPVANALLEAFDIGATNTVNTGEQLQQQAIDLNGGLNYKRTYNYGVHTNMAQQKKAYENIVGGAQKGKYTVFDIEGIGKSVTEVAFSYFDRSTEKELIGAQGWILGLENATAIKMRDLIERARKGKNPRGYRADEEYMLKALQKAGSSKSQVTKDENGFWHFANYASDKDVELLNFKDIEKGLVLFENISNDYNNAGLVDFVFGDSTYKVKKQYQPLLENFKRLKESGQTIVTLNGFGYDMPQITDLFARAGGDTQSAFTALTGGSGDTNTITQHLDVVAILREKNPHIPEEQLKAIARAGVYANSSAAVSLRFDGRFGTGEKLEENTKKLMQEVLGESFYVPHAATSDTVKQGLQISNMFTTIFDPKNKKYIFDKYDDEVRTLQVGDMFMAKDGSFKKFALGELSFTYDQASDSIRYNAGAKISRDGSNAGNDITSHKGLKKDTMYMVSGVRQVDLSEDVARNLATNLGTQTSGATRLVAVAFKPVGAHKNGSDGLGVGDTQVLVGTEQQVQSFLGKNVYMGHQSGENIVEGIKREASKAALDIYHFEKQFADSPLNGGIDAESFKVINEKTDRFRKELFREAIVRSHMKLNFFADADELTNSQKKFEKQYIDLLSYVVGDKKPPRVEKTYSQELINTAQAKIGELIAQMDEHESSVAKKRKAADKEYYQARKETKKYRTEFHKAGKEYYKQQQAYSKLRKTILNEDRKKTLSEIAEKAGFENVKISLVRKIVLQATNDLNAGVDDADIIKNIKNRWSRVAINEKKFLKGIKERNKKDNALREIYKNIKEARSKLDELGAQKTEAHKKLEEVEAIEIEKQKIAGGIHVDVDLINRLDAEVLRHSRFLDHMKAANFDAQFDLTDPSDARRYAYYRLSPEAAKKIGDINVKVEDYHYGLITDQFGEPSSGKKTADQKIEELKKLLEKLNQKNDPSPKDLDLANSLSKAIAGYQVIADGINQAAMSTLESMADISNVRYIDTKGINKKDRDIVGLNGDLSLGSKQMEAIAERSSIVRKNDAVSSWLRDMDFKKAGRALGYLKYIKEYSQLGNAKLTAEQAIEASNKVMQAYHNGDETAVQRLTAIWGWKNRNTKSREYSPNSIENVHKAIGWINDYSDIIRESHTHAARISRNADVQNDSFKMFFDNYIGNIIETVNSYSLRDTPYTTKDKFDRQTLRYTNEEVNKFVIDLTPLIHEKRTANIKGISSSTGYNERMLAIELNSDKNFISSLTNRLGEKSQIEAAIKLKDFILNRYGDLLEEKDRKYFSRQEISQESKAAQNQIRRMLKRIRKADFAAGVPKRASLEDVTHGSELLKDFYLLPKNVQKAVRNKTFSSDSTVEFIEKWDPKKLTDAIVEYSFSSTEHVTEQVLKQYGIDSREASLMLRDREIRKNDLEKKYKAIFKALFDNDANPGIGISFNSKTGELFAYANENKNQYIDLSRHIFLDMFDEANGSFYTMVGNHRIAPHMTLSNDGIHSLFAKPVEEVTISRLRHLNSRDKDFGDRIGYLDWALSQEEKAIAPATTTGQFSDAADRRLSRAIDASDFYQRAGVLYSSGAFNDVSLKKETLTILNDLAELSGGKTLDKDKLTPDQILTINRDFYTIVNELANTDSKLSKMYFAGDKEVAKIFAEKYAPRLNIDLDKSPEDMHWQTSNRELSAIHIGRDFRHAQQVRERSLSMDLNGFVDRAEQYNVLEDKKTYRGVLLGGELFNSPQEAMRHNMTQRADSVQKQIFEYERSIRGNWLTINTKTLTDMVIAAQGDSNSAVSNLKNKSALFKYVNESGSLMDPILLELGQRNAVQNIMTENLMSIDPLITALQDTAEKQLVKQEQERRAKTMEVIELVNGEYKFNYSKDNSILLGRNDVFAYTEDYAGNVGKEKAEYDGFLRKGYFVSGMKEQVSEEAINKIINTSENKKRIEGAVQGAVDESEKQLKLRGVVGEILKEHKIQSKYWIEDSGALGYRKMLVELEKSLSDFMVTGLGQEDDKILAALGGQQAYDKLVGIGPLSMNVLYGNKGKAPDSEMLEQVLKKHGLHLDLSAGGFNSYDEFFNAAVNERRTYYNALMGLLQEHGYKRQGEYIAGVGNLEHEGSKNTHSETQRMEQVAGEAIRARAFTLSKQQNISEEEAVGQATQDFMNELNANKVFADRNGNATVSCIEKAKSLNLGNYFTIDVDSFNSIANNFVEEGDKNGYESFMKDKDGNVVGHRTYVPIRFVSDADRPGYENGTGKGGLKINRRAINNASLAKFDDELINEIWQNHKKLKDILGSDDAVRNEFNEKYGDIATIGEDDKAYMRPEAKDTRVNKEIVRNLNEEIIAGRDPSRRTAYNGSFSRGVAESLEKEGVDRSSQETIVKSLQENGYAVVGADKVKNIYSLARNQDAYYMNKSFADTALTDADKAEIVERYTNAEKGGKFELRTLKDLAESGIASSPNTAIQKSIIVDAGENYKDFGLNTRYIAVGYEPSSKMNGKEYSLSDNVKKLARIGNLYADLQNMGDLASEENQGKAKVRYEGIKDAINDIRENVQANIENKEGQLAEATSGRLAGSQRFKADIITVDQAIHNEALQAAQIDGVSIAERFKQGKRDNIVLVSGEFFKNQLEQGDVKRALMASGLDADAAEQKIKELTEPYLKSLEGKTQAGVEMRWPAEYLGSINGINLVYDKTLNPGQAKVIEGTALQQVMDKDGDLGYVSALREFAKVAGMPQMNDGFYKDNLRFTQSEADLLNKNKDVLYATRLNNEGELDKAVARGSDFMEVATANQERASNGSNIIEDATKNRDYSYMKVNGKMYDVSQLTSGEKAQNQQEFYKISNSNAFKEAAAEYAKDNGVEIDNNLDIETEHLTGDNGIINRYLEKTGNQPHEAEVFATELYNRAAAENAIRQAGKSSAGLINNATYKVERVMNALAAEGNLNLSQGQISAIEGFMIHVKEMGQAAKNSSFVGDLSIENISNAMNEAIGVFGHKDFQKIDSIIDAATDVKELSKAKMPGLPSIAYNDEGFVSADYLKNAFHNIVPEGKTISSNLANAIMTGFKKTNSAKGITLAMTHDKDDLGNATLAAANADRGVDTPEIDTIDATQPEQKFNSKEERAVQAQKFSEENLAKFRESMPEDSFVEPEDIAAGVREDLSGAIKQFGKSIKGSHGTMAMLGFAGATMMAGIIGGAPTSPVSPDEQAQGIQAENAMYEIPSTMSGQGVQSGANQSYIINVNASTDRGRDFATNAINQAFANIGGSNNGSMVMNIKDSSSNIGFGDIARYVGDML